MLKRLAVLSMGVFLVLVAATVADARIRRGGAYGNPEGKVSFATHVGAFVPTNEFGDIADVGIRWGAGLDFYPTPDASLGFDFGFGEADAKDFMVNREENRWDNIVGQPVQIQSFNYRSYRLGVNGRFNIPTGTGVSPYLEAGMGAYWTQRRVNGFTLGGGPFFEFSERRTTSTAGTNVGLGLNAQMGRRTNMFAGFQFHQLFDEQPEGIDNFATFTFGLGIGLWP
ncbi:MAG: porin family protein [candidate division Zixibacteria bacterium]|nr:porin family protein [candidate division Zixibacteria bacterium]MCI0595249.1 porin family protein [candidate division Zixibacteria bacterium]